jgi:glycosyltransferase involved in cell wall biosynthesis
MIASNHDSAAPLSVIVPCFNEETVIAECLASVRFADEIVVVDSFSTDRTVEIAQRHANVVLQHAFWSHGAQNNWAIPQAKHDWVLIVDADERVTPALAEEIRGLLKGPAHDGYWLRRKNFFLNQEIRHGMWGQDSVLRFFRRDKGRYQEKRVHSQVELAGRAGRCREALLHHSYRSLDDYLRKIHRFSQGGALHLQEHGKRSHAGSMLVHALARFFKSYVLKRGFLDGTAGLIIAFMEADHAFLKYAKLWELQNGNGPKPVPVPKSSSAENR